MTYINIFVFFLPHTLITIYKKTTFFHLTFNAKKQTLNSPPHVINLISKEIEAAKLHLEELKENMSEELKEKILLERIDAAKETLLSNMNDAEKDMEELERNLMKYVQKMCFFFSS